MRVILTVFTFLCGVLAHAAHLAPWNPDGDGERAGTVESAFGAFTAETGVGIAAGVAVGLHGTDVAYAGYYTMVNGVPQDTLTSQGLQAVGVPQDWANGIDAGVSMAGTMGVGVVGRTTGIVAYDLSKATPEIGEGATVYRVWGGKARSDGHSWTTVNPVSVENIRSGLGLPDANSGRFLSTGKIINTKGFRYQLATPCDGNPGGLQEILVPNPQTQIRLQSVMGVNPEF